MNTKPGANIKGYFNKAVSSRHGVRRNQFNTNLGQPETKQPSQGPVNLEDAPYPPNTSGNAGGTLTKGTRVKSNAPPATSN